MSKAIYNVNEAAEFLKVSPGTLSNWRLVDRGPAFIKAGSRVLYTSEDLENFIQKCRVETLDSVKKN